MSEPEKNPPRGTTQESPDAVRGTPSRRRGALGRGLARHWQVLLSVVLLVVGSVGLLSTDYDAHCTVQDAASIPDDLLDDLQSASQVSGFPVRVLAAQIEAESGWDNSAKSHAGAVGLAQFTEDTWKIWGQGDRTDESASIAAQGRYMKYLRGQLQGLAGGDEDKLTRYALAGYNAGPNSVKKAKGIPDYPETQRYVQKIMKLSETTYAKTCR